MFNLFSLQGYDGTPKAYISAQGTVQLVFKASKFVLRINCDKMRKRTIRKLNFVWSNALVFCVVLK